MSAEKREHVGRTIRTEVRIAATPEAVYAAWAEPERIARWFVDRAEGRAEQGKVVTWTFDAMGFSMPVPIAEARPGEELVLAGEVPGRPPFLQEIAIEQDGGETILRLANSGFREGADFDDEYEGVASGWDMALATLKHQLERYPERERAHHFAMRPGRYDYGRVMERYATRDGLCSWLAEAAELSAPELAVGRRVKLELKAGGALSGAVLARTSRELLLEWSEREAVLGLKAFWAGPGTRAVALDYSSWSQAAQISEDVPGLLEGALDRLCASLG